MINNEARAMDQNWMSTLDPLLEKFQIGNSIFAAYGSHRANAYMFLKSQGMIKPVSNEKFYHYEDTRKQDLLTVLNSVTAAGPGAALTFTLDPVSMNGAYSYARKFFNVLLPGYVQATITDVSALPNVTITPKDPTVTLAVTAGMQLPVTDSNFAYGSNQPGGVLSRLVRRDFQLQIMKEGLRANGTAATNEASVDVTSGLELGKSLGPAALSMGLGNTLLLRDQLTMDYRMTLQCAYQLYFGQLNNNTALLDNDPNALNGEIKSADGLNATVDKFGNTQNYVVGTMSMADFDATSKLLEQQNVSPQNPIMWLRAYDQGVEFENMMLANNANTFVTYDKNVASSDIFANTSKEVNINFSRLTKSDYTYICMREEIFTDPVGLGSSSLSTSNLGFMIPLAKIKDGDGKLQDSMTIRYKQLGSLNRQYLVWKRNHEITNYDQMDFNILSNQGPEFFGANRFIKFQGQ